MKQEANFTKKDFFVGLACVVFVVAGLGAAGNRGRRRAKEVFCFSQLLRWGRVFRTFAGDNGGVFLPRWETLTWPATIYPYYENPKLLLCPEATVGMEQGGVNPFMAWQREYDEPYYLGYCKGSYCINLWIANEQGSGKLPTQGQEFWRTPSVSGAAKIPVLGDGQWSDADPVQTDKPQENEQDLWSPNTNEMQRLSVNRHNGGINLLYLDFSVRKTGLKQLWKLPWHRSYDVAGPPPVWPYWMENFQDY
jgi:prepilin-type processing-associated H-X9-DG protein